MPQPCWMNSPYFCWNRSMRTRGTADPPAVTARSEDRSMGWRSPWFQMSFQIVGTAMVTVGRSVAIRAVSGAACRYIVGNTKSAPHMKPE